MRHWLGTRLRAGRFCMSSGRFAGWVAPAVRLVAEVFFDWHVLLLSVVVLALIGALRFGNLANLALPLWVDSVHHSAIIRLILAQGGLPTSYRPFADVDTVYYHLGYHVAVAILARVSGWDVEHVMLVFGQVLNVFTSVTLYILAWRWTGRAAAGLMAMVVSGTLSLMPAYYVTWGRYTELMGLMILPVAMLYTREALENGRKRQVLFAGIIAGLLFFVHYRVMFFLATFIVAHLVCYTAYAAWRRKPWRHLWVRATAVALIGGVIASPWLWRLATTFILPLDTFPARITGNLEYNAVPMDLVTQNLNPALYACAVLAAVIGILRRRGRVVVLLAWVVLTVALVNPNIIGLSPSWIVNNLSVAIAEIRPLALMGAFPLHEILLLIEERVAPAWALRLNSMVAVGLVVMAFIGGQGLVNIVNPVTVLATKDDVTALEWIKESTPSNAVFLVNEQIWQGQTYVGTDGGYWIPNLTGRRTTMPIVFYVEGSPAYVADVNSLAQVIAAGPNPDDPEFLALLRRHGVTHVYIGAKGGPLSLQRLQASNYYKPVYNSGTAWIFVVRYPEGANSPPSEPATSIYRLDGTASR